MKITIPLHLSLFLFLFNAVVIQAQTVLDPSFGFQGITKIDFDESTDRGYSILPLPDGKAVLAGWTRKNNQTDFALVRLLNNGNFDDSFGDDGKLALDLGFSNDSCLAAALQPDGKILMAGSATLPGHSYRSFLLVRVEQDGSRDTSFGINGVVTVDVNGADGIANNVIISPDGNIFLAGNAIEHAGDGWPTSVRVAMAQFLPNGMPDSTFGNNGLVFAAFGNGEYSFNHDIALQQDGKIVMTGGKRQQPFDKDEFVVARYKPDGMPDSTFDNDGISIPFGTYAEGSDLAIDANGRIIAAGKEFEFSFAITRLLPDGSLDETFGNNGKKVLSFSPVGFSAADIRVLQNNDILVGGPTGALTTEEMALVRFLANGSIDTTFAPNGMWTASITSTNVLRAFSLLPDGKILAGGDFQFGGSSVNMFVARILPEGTVHLNEAESPVRFMSVYPNPCVNKRLDLTYELSQAGTVTVALSNASGETVASLLFSVQRSAGSHHEQLLLPSVPAGYYVLSVTTSSGTCSTAIFVKN